MYGYAFGAAKAIVWHKWDTDSMIYPQYEPRSKWGGRVMGEGGGHVTTSRSLLLWYWVGAVVQGRGGGRVITHQSPWLWGFHLYR